MEVKYINLVIRNEFIGKNVNHISTLTFGMWLIILTFTTYIHVEIPEVTDLLLVFGRLRVAR